MHRRWRVLSVRNTAHPTVFFHGASAWCLAAFAGLALGTFTPAVMALPPLGQPPVPFENPITEPKRVLGKILFWDEQLSADNTVACGTCHIPSAGGTDPRVGRNPGVDQIFNTADDVLGSPGVVAMDADGNPTSHPLFGTNPQVTRRFSQSVLMAAFSPNFQFWDGRRGGRFINPETGAQSIYEGGALENQATEPILSPVEMGYPGRTWADVRNKLQSATPLALASNIPPDVAAVLENDPTYPQLFEAAFGTPDITAERIAFAIATYERTLVPDQTPWDRFNAGDENAMTEAEKRGFDAFTATNSQCGVCHTGSQFTTHDFQNVGVRPVTEDRGRAEVTGNSADNGRFRAPSLRNVGLQNRFMHNGRFTTLEQVIDFYRRVNGQTQFPGADPVVAQISMTDQQAADLVEFLRTGLTDPRAAAEIFPFDRPTLRSELLDGDLNCDGVVTVSDISPFVLLLTDPAAYNAMFPDCSAAAADLNLDGLISVSDIGAFVGLLTGA